MLRNIDHFNYKMCMTFIMGFNFAGDFYSCTELRDARLYPDVTPSEIT